MIKSSQSNNLGSFVYIASAKGIFQLQNVTVRLACNSLRGGECCDLMRESLGCLNATTMYLDICLMPYENIGSRTCIVHGVSPSLSVANEGSRHKLYYIKQVAIDFTLSWPGAFALGLKGIENTVAKDDVIFSKDFMDPISPNQTWKHQRLKKIQILVKFDYRLICAKDYYGPSCKKHCHDRNDNFGHWKCDEKGQRVCLAHWTGPYCDKAVCMPTCDHGRCQAAQDYIRRTSIRFCLCDSGWIGITCNKCKTDIVCNHGHCRNHSCVCNSGWGGKVCDTGRMHITESSFHNQILSTVQLSNFQKRFSTAVEHESTNIYSQISQIPTQSLSHARLQKTIQSSLVNLSSRDLPISNNTFVSGYSSSQVHHIFTKTSFANTLGNTLMLNSSVMSYKLSKSPHTVSKPSSLHNELSIDSDIREKKTQHISQIYTSFESIPFVSKTKDYKTIVPVETSWVLVSPSESVSTNPGYEIPDKCIKNCDNATSIGLAASILILITLVTAASTALALLCRSSKKRRHMNLSTKLSFSIPHKSLMKNTYGKGSIAPVIDPHIHREANSTMDDIVSVLDFSVPTNDFNMIPVGLGGGETDLYTSKEEELVNSESSADNIERYTLKAVDRICLEAMQCISFSPEEGQKKTTQWMWET